MTKKKPLLSLWIAVVALMLVAVDTHAGLVAWWQAEGNANDSVGGANGFLEGVSFAPGKVGRAFQFNGTNSSVRVPDTGSLDIANNWTLAAWVYTTSLSRHKGGAQGVVSKVGGRGGTYGYQFGIVDGTGEVFLMFNQAGQGWPGPSLRAGKVPLNTWTFIAGSYDNNTMGIYVNGVLAGSKTVGPKSVANSSSSFRIGLDDNGNVDFSGMIDEVRVYNHALSADEIRSLCSAVPGTLAGKWRYQSQSGNFTDVHIYNEDGTTIAPATPQVKASWTVVGNEVVTKWNNGWQNRLTLPISGDQIPGIAIGPAGQRDSFTLTRIREDSAVPSLTGPWVHSADQRTQIPDSKVIAVQDRDHVTLTQTYKTSGRWVTLVCQGSISGQDLRMQCNWAPGGNPFGFANGTMNLKLSSDGNHLDGINLRWAGGGSQESHYSRLP